jgi:hypothetical protein
MQPFYELHNFSENVRINNNYVNRWLGDNCEKSDLNN